MPSKKAVETRMEPTAGRIGWLLKRNSVTVNGPCGAFLLASIFGGLEAMDHGRRA